MASRHGGCAARRCTASLNSQGQTRSLKVYADWTERIAKGEVPPAPPRPTGIERNLVLTLWDVGDDHSFMHDLVSTDKNRPTVNRTGRSTRCRPDMDRSWFSISDELDRGARDSDARAARGGAVALPGAESSVAVVGQRASLVEPAVQPGRSPQPDARQQGPCVDDVEDPPQCGSVVVQRSANKFAAWFPLRNSGRQASFYDPKTRQFVLIDTCYATHHLQFDNDPNETVYFNELSGPIVGWIDSKVYDETKDEQKAVGLVRTGRRHQRRRQDHGSAVESDHGSR